MIIYKLTFLIVILLALLNICSVMAGHGEQNTFKTKNGKCLSFNQVVHHKRRVKRFKTEPCANQDDDPDQWIYIRKINKDEGVFYNFAANQLLCYNTKSKHFQIVEKNLLYRGGVSPFPDADLESGNLRRRLEKLWRRNERCKLHIRGSCSRKRRLKIRTQIRAAVRHHNFDKLLTLPEAKWIVSRTAAKIRHSRKKNKNIEHLLFNLQDKYYGNGFYKIRVRQRDGVLVSMKPKFM